MALLLCFLTSFHLRSIREPDIQALIRLLLLFSHSVISYSLWPHGLQHTRLPCPPSTRASSNSCPLSRWCHPTISSSAIPFSSCLQHFPASGSIVTNWLFTSGGQNIGASASALVLPMNIQDWFSLGLTGLISLPSSPSAGFLNKVTFFASTPCLSDLLACFMASRASLDSVAQSS